MIETRRCSGQSVHPRELGCRVNRLAWLLGGLLLLGGVQSQAAPVLSNDNPVGFFTNAAIRLLIRSGYTVGAPNSTSNLLVTNIVSGVPVTSLQIPIWPNNFYTEAYEAIPSQLLPLLRADSVGYAFHNGGRLQIQFSGSDGLAYAVQVSPDLVNWTSVNTNYPVGGVFSFVEIASPGAPRRFYRSVLLP